MWRATGTDSSMASKAASGPSTLANGVRTPDASQISFGWGIVAPQAARQQRLAFLPLPQGQGSLRPTWRMGLMMGWVTISSSR